MFEYFESLMFNLNCLPGAAVAYTQNCHGCLSHDGLNEKSSKINIFTRRRAKCPTHPVVSKLSFMGRKIVVMAAVNIFTNRLLALLQIKYAPEDIYYKCSVSNVCCLSIYLCSLHPKCHCIIELETKVHPKVCNHGEGPY